MAIGWIRRSAIVAMPALLLVLTAWPAAAATCEPARIAVDAVSLAPTGTSAPVGAPHTVKATVTAKTAGGTAPVEGVCVSFEQVSGPSAGWPRTGTTAADGTVSVTYTSSAAGNDVVFAQAYGEQTATSDRITHRWTAAPSPAASPAKSPATSPAPPAPSPIGSPPQLPQPAGTGAPAPPTPGAAASPAASTSASAPTPQASATSTSPTLGPRPSSSGTGGFTASLGEPSGLPGGSARVSGQGCPAGGIVQLSIGGQPVGTATGNAAGAFTADLRLPQLPIGPHAVDVACGGERTSLSIDLVVSTSGPPVGSRTATAGAILLFFLLLTSMLLSRDQGAPVPIAGEDENRDEDGT